MNNLINITHLHNKPFVILDGDNTTIQNKSKQDVITEIQKQFPKENLHIIDKKAIENILKPEIILDTLLDSKFNLTNHKLAQNHLADLTSILNDPKHSELSITGVFNQIEKNNNATIFGTNYRDKEDNKIKFSSSTKVKLADIATSKINSINDLSAEAKALCKSLTEFIQKNNNLS